MAGCNWAIVIPERHLQVLQVLLLEENDLNLKHKMCPAGSVHLLQQCGLFQRDVLSPFSCAPQPTPFPGAPALCSHFAAQFLKDLCYLRGNKNKHFLSVSAEIRTLASQISVLPLFPGGFRSSHSSNSCWGPCSPEPNPLSNHHIPLSCPSCCFWEWTFALQGITPFSF